MYKLLQQKTKSKTKTIAVWPSMSSADGDPGVRHGFRGKKLLSSLSLYHCIKGGTQRG